MQKFILRIAVSLGFIGFLFYQMKDEIPKIQQTLLGANHRLIAFSTLIFLSSILLLAKRLQLIFEAEDVRLKLGEAANLTFIGYFFNNFLPTSVGGDVVKAMCASRVTGEGVKSVTSVLLDRIFGLFTFILIPSISLIFFAKDIQNASVPILIYSLLALSIASFLVLFNKGVARRLDFLRVLIERFHWGDKIKKIYEGLHAFKRHRGVMTQAMLLSVVGQSVSIFVLYLLALALGAKTHVVYFFMVVPVVHLMSMIPSLGGLGVRESAYTYFLKGYIGAENAFALGILWLALLLLLSLIGAVIYLVRHDYHIRFGKTGPAVS